MVTTKDLAAEDPLEVPDPVALQLKRAGGHEHIEVVTDRPPPVRQFKPPRRGPTVVKVR